MPRKPKLSYETVKRIHEMLEEGTPNKVIAVTLGISSQSVSDHTPNKRPRTSNKQYNISKELKEEIRNLYYFQGKKMKEISKEYNIGVDYLYRRIINQRDRTKALYNEAIELLNDGYTRKEIAQKLNTAESTIREILKNVIVTNETHEKLILRNAHLPLTVLCYITKKPSYYVQNVLKTHNLKSISLKDPCEDQQVTIETYEKLKERWHWAHILEFYLNHTQRKLHLLTEKQMRVVIQKIMEKKPYAQIKKETGVRLQVIILISLALAGTTCLDRHF